MIYLDTENIIVPKVNSVVGDKIKFVNQVTKDEVVCDLSDNDTYYILDSCTNLNGQYDYFIYASNSP